MHIESVIQALTEPDLRSAWTAFLTEIMAGSRCVAATSARFVLCHKPILSVTLTMGPRTRELHNYLELHSTRTRGVGGTRVMPWTMPAAGLELADVPAGIYVAGCERGCLEQRLINLDEPRVIVALRHTYIVFKALLAGMMYQTLKDEEEAVMLLDARGHIHARNWCADALLSGDTLSESESHLLLVRGIAADQDFKRALAAFFEHRRTLQRERLGKEMLVILKQPGLSWPNQPLARVAFRKVKQPIAVVEDDLKKLRGVTAAQARLAKALGEGMSVTNYAKETGLTVRGVKYHMSGLMQRMECHTQAEVVKELLRMFG